MTYQFYKGNPATGADAVFEMKEIMVTAGWTVMYSGTGLSGTHGASDLITSGSVLNATDAWFRIRHPDGARELIIQRIISSTSWRIKFSLAAGFTGAPSGGGSIDEDHPASATDEEILKGGGTDAVATGESMFSTDGSYRWKVGVDDTSPYNMYAFALPTGGGSVTSSWIIETLDQLQATDADGTYIFLLWDDPVFGNLWLDTVSNGSGHCFVPSATPTVWTPYGAFVYYSDSVRVVPTNIGTNAISGEDELFPVPFGRKAGVANSGYKGVSAQIKWAGTARSSGDTLTVSTTRDRIIFGDISVPWDGTVPVV